MIISRANSKQNFGALDLSRVAEKERGALTKELGTLAKERLIVVRSGHGIQASLFPPRIRVKDIYDVTCVKENRTNWEKFLNKIGLFPNPNFSVTKKGIENRLRSHAQHFISGFEKISETMGERKASRFYAKKTNHTNFDY